MAEVKSATGLRKETSGALAYILGPITGVIFLIVEKDPFVRFHAIQSIVVLGGLIVLQWVLGITLILAILIPLVGLVWFVSWLMLIYKAWLGEEWDYPFLGKYAREILKKV